MLVIRTDILCLPVRSYGTKDIAITSSFVKDDWSCYRELVGTGGTMPSLLGTKINALRRARGLTLEQLAKRTGSSKSYMWEIENKDVTRPSAEKLDKIAIALDVTTQFLIDADQEHPTESTSDEAFYRKYQRSDPSVKSKLMQILDILDDE